MQQEISGSGASSSTLALRQLVDTCKSPATKRMYVNALRYFMEYLRLPTKDYHKLLDKDAKLIQMDICNFVTFMKKDHSSATVTPVLEEFDIFSKFKSPSRKLMQYAESFLSNNKADYAHNVTVSFKNCMLRIPGSINSKNDQTVKLLQLWDGHFPKINPLLADFYIYLCGQRIKELTNQQSNQLNRSRFGFKAYVRYDGHGSYYQSISRYLRFRKTYFMSSPS